MNVNEQEVTVKEASKGQVFKTDEDWSMIEVENETDTYKENVNKLELKLSIHFVCNY